MGREIKFRLIRDGKIVGYEKWYPGAQVKETGFWTAQPKWLYSTDGEYWAPKPIRHDSKGQYTGLKDRKRTKEFPEGQEIYEGDWLGCDEGKIPGKQTQFGGVLVKFGAYDDSDLEWGSPAIGWYVEGFSGYYREDGSVDRYPVDQASLLSFLDDYEIIGNLHTNPELLDG